MRSGTIWTDRAHCSSARGPVARADAAALHEGTLAANMLLGMVERSSRHSEAQDPGPQARCVCGEKVIIPDAREVTLPNGRPGWGGRCPECGAPLFAIRR